MKINVICTVATQEVPIKKYLKEIVSQDFKIYAIELLGSLPTDEA